MAENYTKADIDYIYNTLINGGEKAGDVARILKNLPATFTLADLQSKANLKGLSSRSQGLWNQALQALQGAESAAPATTKSGDGGSTTPAPTTTPTDAVSQYMAPQGPVTDALTSLLTGQGGSPWAQGPFTAGPSPAEMYGLGRLASLQPTAPSALENLIGLYAGRGPQGLTPPASGFEQNLGLLSQNPYLAQIAAGQIPQSMMDALNNQMNLSRSNTLEATNMGGALTSSDLAEGLSRAESDARTNFLASMADKANAATGTLGSLLGTGGGLYNTRTGLGSSLFSNLLGQGIGAQQGRQQLDLNTMLGLFNPLISTGAARQEGGLNRYLQSALGMTGQEANRGQAATNLAFQDYLGKQGLPPQIGALLSLFSSGLGSKGTTTQTGGGLQDLLGLAGMIGGSALLGGGLGGLGGLFSGGGGGATQPVGGWQFAQSGSYGGIPQFGTSTAIG